MQDKELYEKLLGLSAPWSVREVDLQIEEMKVTLKLTHQPLWRFRCPECDPNLRRSVPFTNIARESGDTLRLLRRSRREPVGIEIGQDFEP